jgi:hypothetical protein
MITCKRDHEQARARGSMRTSKHVHEQARARARASTCTSTSKHVHEQACAQASMRTSKHAHKQAWALLTLVGGSVGSSVSVSSVGGSIDLQHNQTCNTVRHEGLCPLCPTRAHFHVLQVLQWLGCESNGHGPAAGDAHEV